MDIGILMGLLGLGLLFGLGGNEDTDEDTALPPQEPDEVP